MKIFILFYVNTAISAKKPKTTENYTENMLTFNGLPRKCISIKQKDLLWEFIFRWILTLNLI